MLSQSKCCVQCLNVQGDTSDKQYPQECILGPVLVNIFSGDMDRKTECTLSMFLDGIKLCDMVDMLEGRDA